MCRKCGQREDPSVPHHLESYGSRLERREASLQSILRDPVQGTLTPPPPLCTFWESQAATQVIHHQRQRLEPQSNCTRTTTKRKGQVRSKRATEGEGRGSSSFCVGAQFVQDKETRTCRTNASLLSFITSLNEAVSAKLLDTSRQHTCVVRFRTDRAYWKQSLGLHNPARAVRCPPPARLGSPFEHSLPEMVPTCNPIHLVRSAF